MGKPLSNDAVRHYVRIGFVDDDPMVRDDIRVIFTRHEAPIDILWVEQRAEAAINNCNNPATRPEVLVSDIEMPDMNALEMARRLHTNFPRIPIIGITAFPVHASEAWKAGIDTVLHKDDPLQTLVRAIGVAASNPDVAKWEDKQRHPRLTPSEQRIMSMYARGITTHIIASELNISRSTIKTHMDNIYAKLGAHNRSEAVSICTRLGLI